MRYIWRLEYWWPGERTPWFFIYPTRKQCIKTARRLNMTRDLCLCPKDCDVERGQYKIESLDYYYHGA